MRADNKHSYFKVTLKASSLLMDAYKGDKNQLLDHFENRFEPIFAKMNASLDKTYLIADKSYDNSLITVLFRTEERKRMSLLRNTLIRYIKPYIESERYRDQNYEMLCREKIIECEPISIGKFNEYINKASESRNMLIRTDSKSSGSNYSHSDIKLLNNKENWFPWQKQLYDMLYDKNKKVKEAAERKIIFIEDPTGNNGKSTFMKWLKAHETQPNEIGLLSEGTAGQLKSAAITLSQENTRIYIIDLPRTEAESLNGLYNAVEMIKNGMLNSNFYGRHMSYLNDIPHIIITGNSRLPLSGWSIDRWQVYTIDNKTKKLIDISEKKQKEARMMLKNQAIEDEIEQIKLKKKYKENLKLLRALKETK